MVVLQPPPPPAAAVTASPSSSRLVEVPQDPDRPTKPGHVTLKCHVTPQGGLDRCAVTEETPVDAGLGALALRLAAKMHLEPKATAGGRLRDGVITIPMAFKVSAESSPGNEQGRPGSPRSGPALSLTVT